MRAGLTDRERFMRSYKFAGASLVLACVGASQSLAPDVLLLAGVEAHMREELTHVPNYTCLETIARFRNAARPSVQVPETVEPA